MLFYIKQRIHAAKMCSHLSDILFIVLEKGNIFFKIVVQSKFSNILIVRKQVDVNQILALMINTSH